MAYVRPRAEACQNAAPSIVGQLESVEAWRFPFLSKVEEVIGVLRRAAGEEI
jgi:hypothetical protein